ncbi:MAG: alpha/beta hydrolase [Spirochaetota bacterium]|nr:alpha/beta hydrolase [Spirochaetota bacterium]
MNYRFYIILCICLVVTGCLDSVIYHPDTMTPTTSALPFPAEDVFIHLNETVTLHGWFISSQTARFTVCYFHGNAGNIYDRIELLKLLHSIPLSIFIIDYRGYGKSSGKPSEKGLYEDAMAAWEYLTDVKKISPKEIILFGRSLGGPIALYCASRTNPAGIIIDSSFTSIKTMVQYHSSGCMSLFFKEKYPAIDYIQKIAIPVLILHSRDDETAPFSMGQELYRQCPSNKKYFVELRGGHNNNFLVDAPLYRNSIKEFVLSLTSEE